MKSKCAAIFALTGLLTLGISEDGKNLNESLTETESFTPAAEAKTTEGEEKPKYTEYDGPLPMKQLESSSVFNLQEEEIGSVDQLILNAESGEISYAVLSVGGFLGIGDRLVAVPWSQFSVKMKLKPEFLTKDESEIREELEEQEIAETDLEPIDPSVGFPKSEAEKAGGEITEAPVAEETKGIAEVNIPDAVGPAPADAPSAPEENLAIGGEPESEVATDSLPAVSETDPVTGPAESEVADYIIEVEPDEAAFILFLDASKEKLEKAPEYDPKDPGSLSTEGRISEAEKYWSPDLSSLRGVDNTGKLVTN